MMLVARATSNELQPNAYRMCTQMIITFATITIDRMEKRRNGSTSNSCARYRLQLEQNRTISFRVSCPSQSLAEICWKCSRFFWISFQSFWNCMHKHMNGEFLVVGSMVLGLLSSVLFYFLRCTYSVLCVARSLIPNKQIDIETNYENFHIISHLAARYFSPLPLPWYLFRPLFYSSFRRFKNFTYFTRPIPFRFAVVLWIAILFLYHIVFHSVGWCCVLVLLCRFFLVPSSSLMPCCLTMLPS